MGYQTDEVFWGLMDDGAIYNRMAELILTSSQDLTDQLRERASAYVRFAFKAHRRAWDHFYELNPGTSPEEKLHACPSRRMVLQSA